MDFSNLLQLCAKFCQMFLSISVFLLHFSIKKTKTFAIGTRFPRVNEDKRTHKSTQGTAILPNTSERDFISTRKQHGKCRVQLQPWNPEDIWGTWRGYTEIFEQLSNISNRV